MSSSNSKQLLPAIRVKVHGQLFVGKAGDAHSDIERRHKVHTWDDAQRGFTPDSGSTFLSRREAADWVKDNDPFLWAVVNSQVEAAVGLHSHHLAPTVNLATKSALVYDKGLYVYSARKLGEQFGKVYYYTPSSSPYPKSAERTIGSGYGEIQHVDEFWPYVDKVDIIVFFDAYEGELQHWLRSKGYRVFGSGRSEKFELDKCMFLDELEACGLAVPPTVLTRGLFELEEHLRLRKDRWLKTPYYRGDFETHHHTTWKQTQPWLSWLRTKIGEGRAKDIPVLVQSPIESHAEVGYDGFCVDGKYTSNCLVGYEVKDKGLVAKVFEETPTILAGVNDATAPLFERLGYRGHYSTELRVTSTGIPYFIDPTCRVPSPPGELMCEIYANYPHAIWQIACGLVPVLEPIATYGAEIVLSSTWHGWDTDDSQGRELCVQFPDSLAPHVKLKNCCKRGDAHYIIPNYNAGAFGNVVAWADDMEEAIEKAKAVVEEIECDGLDWDEGVFDKAEEAVKAGSKFGIKWG